MYLTRNYNAAAHSASGLHDIEYNENKERM